MRKRVPGRLNLHALLVLAGQCHRARLNQVPAVGSDSASVHGHGQGFNQQPGGEQDRAAFNPWAADRRPTAAGFLTCTRPNIRGD